MRESSYFSSLSCRCSRISWYCIKLLFYFECSEKPDSTSINDGRWKGSFLFEKPTNSDRTSMNVWKFVNVNLPCVKLYENRISLNNIDVESFVDKDVQPLRYSHPLAYIRRCTLWVAIPCDTKTLQKQKSEKNRYWNCNLSTIIITYRTIH